MGDSACVMHYDSAGPNDSKQGNPMHLLGDSISLGRFMNEPLSWEKWSAFSHKKYVEEAESYSKPGLVAQQKAFFEAHYKRIAAQKAEAMLEQEASANDDNGTLVEGQVSANNNSSNSSQRISLKLDSHLVDDEKMDIVKTSDAINVGVVSENENSSVSVSEDAKEQKNVQIMGDKYSGEVPLKKPRRKKRFFSKYFCDLYNLFPTKEPDNEPYSATKNTEIIGIAPGALMTPQNRETPLKNPPVEAVEGVSKNPAGTIPSKSRRKKTPKDPSVPESKTIRRKWRIFSVVSKSSK